MAGTAVHLLQRVLTTRPLANTTLFLMREGVQRFGKLLPRDMLEGIDSFFFRDAIGNVDRDGDGVPDSFRLSITGAWFEQRITGVDLAIDGHRVPPEALVVRTPEGETRACDIRALEYRPGAATELIAVGYALGDGLHLLDLTVHMELASQIIPVLPVLMRGGVGDLPVLPDCGAPLPPWPPGELPRGRAHLVPHTHYDVEWLHTREVFERVGAANLLEALELMEADPERTFMIDQVPQLEPFRVAHPEAFARLVELVREGRVEAANGMYSEPDANLLSGEALVRQSVAWQRYALEHFGTLSRCGWLIDSFGMSAQLPQILARSGTESIAFSRARPATGTPSEFLWEGLDGTTVTATCMPRKYNVGYPMPADRPRALRKMLKDYLLLRGQSAGEEVFYPAGVDHGRPQPEHGEMARAWNEEVEGVRFEFSTPTRFFDAVSRESLPVVRGEFQRELWGTNSARIGLKQLNRAAEFALAEAGKLAFLASLGGAPYPRAALDDAWREVMDCQFHDQIGGCHVDAVTRGMEERFGAALSVCEDVMRDAAGSLAAPAPAGDGYTLLVFNPLSVPVQSWVQWELDLPPGWRGLQLTAAGERLPLQVLDAARYGDGTLRKVVAGCCPALPPLGFRTFAITRADDGGEGEPEVSNTVGAAGGTLANGLITVTLDRDTGLLQRAVLADGTGFDLRQGNRLTLERDFGNLYQAIALGTTFMHRRRVHRVRVAEQGPLRATLEVQGTLGRSPFVQRISLAHGSRRIDMQTSISFNDPHCRLRCRFPTYIHGGATWTHEVPYGVIERPAHELAAQNFVDLSLRGGGLTLINSGIPGNKLNAISGTMYLTLLRSCDKLFLWDSGKGALELRDHEFSYALYPHRGGWREAGSLLQAYLHNEPPRAFVMPGLPGAGTEGGACALTCDCDHALVSVLERDRDGASVLRLWETEGRESTPTLMLGWQATAARKTDLLERPLQELAVDGCRVEVPLGPFEIATVVVE